MWIICGNQNAMINLRLKQIKVAEMDDGSYGVLGFISGTTMEKIELGVYAKESTAYEEFRRIADSIEAKKKTHTMAGNYYDH